MTVRYLSFLFLGLAGLKKCVDLVGWRTKFLEACSTPFFQPFDWI